MWSQDMGSSPDATDVPWPLPRRIGYGHAWSEHRVEFPEVSDREAFAQLVAHLLRTGERKELNRGRVAYWSDEVQAIVIVSPSDPDGGTAFRPVHGRAYFDELVARSR